MRLISATVRKWRTVSSMYPRQGKRGLSRRERQGTVHATPSTFSALSISAGSSWRSVCTPWKTPAAFVAVMVTPDGVHRRAYPSSPNTRRAGSSLSAIPPLPDALSGSRIPVAGAIRSARYRPTASNSGDRTTMAVFGVSEYPLADNCTFCGFGTMCITPLGLRLNSVDLVTDSESDPSAVAAAGRCTRRPHPRWRS